MSNLAVIEKRFLNGAERLAGRESVKLSGEGLDALKPIVRGGCLKLELMGMADDESRIDAAESNLAMLVRGAAKEVKGAGSYVIDGKALEKVLSRSAIWPFS